MFIGHGLKKCVVTVLICMSAVRSDFEIETDLKSFIGSLENYAASVNDVVFLLDESGSINVDRFQHVKEFTKLCARILSVWSEQSRIAVVTFATKTIPHINYIGDPYGKNMCTLLRDISKIGYVGEWTHTDLAMLDAENILKNARPTSNKIIVLITDGQSNAGHSPIEIATKLKQNGIIIFAVGVADVNEGEIYSVASGREYAYILTNFDHIVEVNKKLVGDSSQNAWDKASDSLCDKPCDDNAGCYCGTKTGSYECVCNAGYYGSGFNGTCHKCRRGTYKNSTGNVDCADCPIHSTNLKTGSTSANDCECNTGYQKIGESCVPVRCAALTAPEGGILVPQDCNNTYGTHCSFQCLRGHCPFSCKAIKQDVISSNRRNLNFVSLADRMCTENQKWTGNEFYCEKVKCPTLDFPNHGRHNCSNSGFTYETVCDFMCDKGYEIRGSQHRICLLNESWSGASTTCERSTCARLKTNDYLFVKPEACGIKDMPYGSVCQYHCREGYTLVSSSNSTVDGVNKCLADKKWSGSSQDIFCQDISPPNIQCPQSITVNTDLNKNNAAVYWDFPNATDNVGVKTILVIEPKNIKKPPYLISIGTTKITYEAVDDNGITSTCSFSVTVIDKEPPQVMSCPDDIEVYSETRDHIPVTWEEPTFVDNSKQELEILNNSKPAYSWSSSQKVSYTATDPSGNIAYCNFTVKVKPYPCPYYSPPANGVLTCDSWQDGKMCNVYCHSGFEFASKDFHNVYICEQVKQGGSVKARWQPFSFDGKIKRNTKLPWPDCAARKKPSGLDISVDLVYDVDICSEEVIREMKQRFYDYWKQHIFFCSKEQGCHPDNVNVTCGDTKTRKKRNIPESSKQNIIISFHVVLENTTKDTDSPDSVLKDLKAMESSVSENVKLAYHMDDVPKPNAKYDVVVICAADQIIANNSCVSCTRGTYKDMISGTCIDCPQATYQDEEGQFSCKPCSEGYTTLDVKSRFKEECRAPCEPGTYSKTTFEPCLACELNTYQERAGRKECLKCPTGLYTWKTGSNSSKDCVAPCKIGTYSDTGFEPCTPCDVGYYQEMSAQKECNICPNRMSTSQSGAISESDCKEIDVCKEKQPCMHGSTCRQIDKSYECLCPEGLKGAHCQINLDSCESNPCVNNGTCKDGIGNFTCECPVGYFGGQCEKETDECESGPCFNGGSCTDLHNNFKCHCLPGFDGDRCEINIYECDPNPCQNNGTCFDMQNGYRCCCPEGYYGKNCENVTHVCDLVECNNGGTCTEKDDGFKCECVSGFEGEFCENDINYCQFLTCQNGGTCIDGIDNATCLCPKKFSGMLCEEALGLQFTLSFPSPLISNFVKLKNDFILHAITVSFYMRTNYKDKDSRATPVSYSYKERGTVEDNGLTLYDTNNIILYLHGVALHTGYTANKDSDWHHYAVAWETKDGKWAFYVDGISVASGSNIGKNKLMWPGVFILGQEQDAYGTSFDSLEAFAGDITEFNVWDYILTTLEITELSSSCGTVGNIIPWFTAQKHIHGDVVLSRSSSACRRNCTKSSCGCVFDKKDDGLNVCKHKVERCSSDTCQNQQPCNLIDEQYFCNCSSGYDGRHCEYDVDECLQDHGGCQYSCKNAAGSYRCECPLNMVLSEDGKTCKDAEYCMDNGKVYEDKETWIDSCQTCTCNRGTVQCEYVACNETSCSPDDFPVTVPGECCPKCSSWSRCMIQNKTVVTFENTTYELDGHCSFTLVEDCIYGRFKVVLEAESQEVVYQNCDKAFMNTNGSAGHQRLKWDNNKGEVIIEVPTIEVHMMCGLCSSDETLSNHYYNGKGKYKLSSRSASGHQECFADVGKEDLANRGSHSSRNNLLLQMSSVLFVYLLTLYCSVTF